MDSNAEILEGELLIQIASDLHLEFYGRELPSVRSILKPSAPILALLGDISVLGHPDDFSCYESWLTECCTLFDKILVLTGNHEYYCEGKSKVDVGTLVEQLREVCARVSEKAPSTCSGVEVLENQAITVNGVRIAGTTLWSHIHPLQTVDGAASANKDPMNTVEYRMTDFRRIYEALDGRCELVRCSELNGWHEAAVAFIEAEAKACTSIQQPLLVLSHHAPSFKITSPRHAAEAHPSGFGCGFSTDLERLLSQRGPYASIHTWAFGHTHFNVDMAIGKVRVVSNQRGYKDDPAEGYKKDFVLRIPSIWPPAAAHEQRRAKRQTRSSCTLS